MLSLCSHDKGTSLRISSEAFVITVTEGLLEVLVFVSPLLTSTLPFINVTLLICGEKVTVCSQTAGGLSTSFS